VISPLRYRLTWQDRMAAEGATVSEAAGSLERVVWEDGTWRLPRIWSEEQSRRNRDEIDQGRSALRQATRR
jgi:hypothetical protein